MRRRYRQDPVTLKFHEVSPTSAEIPETPFVWDDTPGYESPITGLWVEGRRARREDLKRHRCRPYEGREQELKEAQRHKAELDRRDDALADRMAHVAWRDAPERIRKLFRGN